MDNRKHLTFIIVGLVITSLLIVTLLTIFKEHFFSSQSPFIWSISLAIALPLYEIMTILVIDKKEKEANHKKTVSLYTLLKAIKSFLFIFVAVIYIVLVKIESKSFILVIATIYFIYLLLNTTCLLAIEKRKKKFNENRN